LRAFADAASRFQKITPHFHLDVVITSASRIDDIVTAIASQGFWISVWHRSATKYRCMVRSRMTLKHDSM
jgi:hypothetical protein